MELSRSRLRLSSAVNSGDSETGISLEIGRFVNRLDCQRLTHWAGYPLAWIVGRVRNGSIGDCKIEDAVKIMLAGDAVAIPSL